MFQKPLIGRRVGLASRQHASGVRPTVANPPFLQEIPTNWRARTPLP